MGEMKNLKPGDRGYKFLQRIDEHNQLLARSQRRQAVVVDAMVA